MTLCIKIEVPASWADAQDAPDDDHELDGNPATVKMVKEIMEPVDKMDGDSLPVSAFVDHVDGQFEQGASAYEKRGVAVMRARVGCYKVHPVQPVRLCLPARHHPSVCSDRRGSCRPPPPR